MKMKAHRMHKKNKTILIRWFSARVLCLTHIAVSIFLLLAARSAQHLIAVPVIGITLITLEIIVFSSLKFRYQYSCLLLLIYSMCIISSIWLLELYKINHLITAKDQRASVEVFSVVYYAPIPPDDTFLLYNKYLWAELQIQIYMFIVVILKGLCETKDHRFNIIVKTWTNALDVLDFISLLDQPNLYSDSRFVYLTLSIWSISCLQFVIPMIMIKKIFLKYRCPRLASIMTYSLLSMIITDIPYLIIRLYTILGVSRHDYTSYFLVFKNIVIITLQTTDVWIVFNENGRNMKNIAHI